MRVAAASESLPGLHGAAHQGALLQLRPRLSERCDRQDARAPTPRAALHPGGRGDEVVATPRYLTETLGITTVPGASSLAPLPGWWERGRVAAGGPPVAHTSLCQFVISLRRLRVQYAPKR